MKAGREDHVTIPDHVRVRQFDDELVILDLSAGEYFSLSGSGARIWLALASGMTPAQIASSLVDEYEVQEDTLLADCLSLVDELLHRRLVRRAEQ